MCNWYTLLPMFLFFPLYSLSFRKKPFKFFTLKYLLSEPTLVISILISLFYLPLTISKRVHKYKIHRPKFLLLGFQLWTILDNREQLHQMSINFGTLHAKLTLLLMFLFWLFIYSLSSKNIPLKSFILQDLLSDSHNLQGDNLSTTSYSSRFCLANLHRIRTQQLSCPIHPNPSSVSA